MNVEIWNDFDKLQNENAANCFITYPITRFLIWFSLKINEYFHVVCHLEFKTTSMNLVLK